MKQKNENLVIFNEMHNTFDKHHKSLRKIAFTPPVSVCANAEGCTYDWWVFPFLGEGGCEAGIDSIAYNERIAQN